LQPPRSASRTRRIACIVPGFSADECDACIPVLRNFIRDLSRHIEPVVYTLHYPYTGLTYSVHGVTVHSLSRTGQKKLRRLLLWRNLRQHIERDHASAPFDLLHAFWGTETGYMAGRIASRLGIPSIVTMAGGEMAQLEREGYGAQLSRAGRWLVAQSIDRATAITSGSEWMSRLLPAEAHSKLRTIPLGIDTETFTPGEVRSGRSLLSVASVIPLKDHPTLLHAVAIARKTIPDLTLDVIGYQDETEMLRVRRLITELDLREAVRFHGQLSYDRMPEIFRRHDLLLHSSLYEAEGMVLLEALATGLPVVSSDVGIAPSLPEELVYRFAPGDADRMALMILRSLSNDDHARRAIEQGPELMRREYSMEVTVKKFLKLYDDLRQASSL
jgi:glycosyltransferase involved in cell wall biosynthesis